MKRFLILLIVTIACAPGSDSDKGPDEIESISPSARLATVEMLNDDLAARRHPSDGGGRAWLEDPQPVVTVSEPRTYHIIYEAGPLGIDDGGMVFLLVSPFWGWSEPQVSNPERPGYTEVSCDAQGVELEAIRLDSYLLGISIGGRTLIEGETIHIFYGFGSIGAQADQFAESESPLWIAVDGDGDGVRKVLPQPPTVRVVAARAAQIVLSLPSIVRPGETARLTIAILDTAGNAGVDFTGSITMKGEPDVPGLQRSIHFASSDLGKSAIDIPVPAAGEFRIAAHGPGDLSGESNPALVAATGSKIYWCDLHGHSGLSDGTGTPTDYLSYARDVAGLDAVALTDHDHWGITFLDSDDRMWQRISDATSAFHAPGRFVTFLGYEWTSWIHGHRHVLYFADEGTVYSSIDPAFDTPAELWHALEGSLAMTFAHHSAGGPVATNWEYEPDPRFETVTEIVSVHGSSEAMDSPHPIYSAVPGNFARDTLDLGYQLGFIGSGDSHDGHPGLAHLGSPTGGIAAIIADELTRESLHEALKARRCYATNGPRIILRFAVNGKPMGSSISIGPDNTASIVIVAHGTAAIDRIDLIRSGEIIASHPGDGSREAALSSVLTDIESGEYVYTRVVQSDEGAAWSSPVFFD